MSMIFLLGGILLFLLMIFLAAVLLRR